MPVTTTRLIIVCTAAVKDQMNATLNQVDPSSTGDSMAAALALAGGDVTVPVGYWTSWAMTAENRSAVQQAFAQQGWRPLKGSEGLILGPSDPVPAWGTQRFWTFDGVTVNHEYVLTSLGLTRVQYPS